MQCILTNEDKYKLAVESLHMNLFMITFGYGLFFVWHIICVCKD